MEFFKPFKIVKFQYVLLKLVYFSMLIFCGAAVSEMKGYWYSVAEGVGEEGEIKMVTASSPRLAAEQACRLYCR